MRKVFKIWSPIDRKVLLPLSLCPPTLFGKEILNLARHWNGKRFLEFKEGKLISLFSFSSAIYVNERMYCFIVISQAKLSVFGHSFPQAYHLYSQFISVTETKMFSWSSFTRCKSLLTNQLPYTWSGSNSKFFMSAFINMITPKSAFLLFTHLF